VLQTARDTYASKPPTANWNKYGQVLLSVNFHKIAMTILLSQSNEQKFDHLITQYVQKPALWPALMYTVDFL